MVPCCHFNFNVKVFRSWGDHNCSCIGLFCQYFPAASQILIKLNIWPPLQFKTLIESTWTGHVSSQNLRLNKKSKKFWVGDNFFSINQSNDELQLIVISLILWFFVFCQLVGNRLLAKMWFLYRGGHHFSSFLSLWWCTSSLRSVFFFFFSFDGKITFLKKSLSVLLLFFWIPW